MNEFFEGLSKLEQIYWSAAIIGSIVLAIVFILTFMGGDADADIDADTEFEMHDGDVGFQFFSFKNIVAFVTIFGWSGLSCIKGGLSTGMTLFISTIAGLLMMIITGYMFYFVHKLAENGKMRIENAIGQVGEVYIPIGANRSKLGKVHLTVQGTLRELNALTDNQEELGSGTVIKVIEIIGSETLLVEKLSK
jgi:membrane protein implicated in regulation of membrane protease activity